MARRGALNAMARAANPRRAALSGRARIEVARVAGALGVGRARIEVARVAVALGVGPCGGGRDRIEVARAAEALGVGRAAIAGRRASENNARQRPSM